MTYWRHKKLELLAAVIRTAISSVCAFVLLFYFADVLGCTSRALHAILYAAATLLWAGYTYALWRIQR